MPTTTPLLDEQSRFILDDYQGWRPFASFLPGIAGLHGIPMWVFYVNRGQAIAGFGIEDKDQALMEFQPANKAYQSTPYLGFRTFLKVRCGGNLTEELAYEPFAAGSRGDAPGAPAATQRMRVGANELVLEEIHPQAGLKVEVTYFILPGEPFAGLVRQVSFTNLGSEPVHLEILDGLATLIPYGLSNTFLKEIHRTVEAWMEVTNLPQNLPFFRLRASPNDTTEVREIEGGHFFLAFLQSDQAAALLPCIVDPQLVFAQNTSLSRADGFYRQPLADLLAQPQVACGKTPCGFAAAALDLAPGQAATLSAIFGHARSLESLQAQVGRVTQPGYLQGKHSEAVSLVRALTAAIETHTSSPLFDEYCRQTFLDNGLRGGWPVLFGDGQHVYHVYSRKHGDLERDYNAFYLAAEFYSQGNGNYRDINQNRRSDVLFNPRVGDFNVRALMSLIQADGFNPLVVQGSEFLLSPAARAGLLSFTSEPARLEPLLPLRGPFTPGRLLGSLESQAVPLSIPADEFLALAVGRAEQRLQAAFGEGYWIDHWTYNLDLIESYLAVYPERQGDLLFQDNCLPFYESPFVVQPRAKRYVLIAGDQPRQLNSLVEDGEKAAQIASRIEAPNWLRADHGQGAIYTTSLFVKLFCLALNKFTSLDPEGMGVEMEAGRPGWYDALNGLPALFGSSLSETYELSRLLALLRLAVQGDPGRSISMPLELANFLTEVNLALELYSAPGVAARGLAYWDAMAYAREVYRDSIRLGFGGAHGLYSSGELDAALARFEVRVNAGLERASALNGGMPPAYFLYRVAAYERLVDECGDARRDPQGRPYIRPTRFDAQALPLFLEGAVKALKTAPTPEAARSLYACVKQSPLYDQKLKMYRVNASLAELPFEIGRARAFPPGWLENESIWLHMEYKYLLEVLKSGLYDEFYQDFRSALIPFLDARTYGRSLLENSSFIASSAHPDPSLHGAGFVARLSGSTAEFLSIWYGMMAGFRPFQVRDGELCLCLRPALPGWLFPADGELSFRFLGRCEVVYHNPGRLDTYAASVRICRWRLTPRDGAPMELTGELICSPYAEHVRSGSIARIEGWIEVS